MQPAKNCLCRKLRTRVETICTPAITIVRRAVAYALAVITHLICGRTPIWGDQGSRGCFECRVTWSIRFVSVGFSFFPF